MTKVKWTCTACNKTGIMESPDHIDFWEGYQQLIAEHRKVSPNCKFDNLKVTVVDLKKQTEIKKNEKITSCAQLVDYCQKKVACTYNLINLGDAIEDCQEAVKIYQEYLKSK